MLKVSKNIKNELNNFSLTRFPLKFLEKIIDPAGCQSVPIQRVNPLRKSVEK